MNEAFATNMTGKEIDFDVQPYSRGRMLITKVTPRTVKNASGFDIEKGRTYTTYECFDIEGTVIEGSETPALICGVPMSHNKLNGKTHSVIGVSFGQLYRAVEKGQTIVKVCCG